ncbi:MAG: hypothetical protein ABL902_03430 [Gallionella sp.]
MKTNQIRKPTKLVALLASAAMLGLVSQNALAAVSLAGSTIGNIATLQYAVGGVNQNSISSSPTGNSVQNATPTTIGAIDANGVVTVGNGASTNFLVDYKVNVLVSGGTVANVTPGQAAGLPATAGAYTTFTVQNLSNNTQDFVLSAADATIGTVTTALALKSTAATDAFDSTGLTMYLDTDNSGTLNAGDTAITSINLPASGLANSTRTVFVASAIPVTATNGQSSVVSLQAQAVWPAVLPTWAPSATANGNTAAVANGVIVATAAGTPNNAGTTVDIVFADTVAGVIDAVRDGKDSAYDTYTIQSASLSVAKAMTLLCDPVNGSTNPKNIPGAYVQYAITITNSGTAAATLSQITDALQTQLTADPLLISGSGAGTNCAPGIGSLSASGFGALRGAGVVTSYAAPGLAGQNVTAGASVAGQNVTIDFTTLAGTAYGAVNATLSTNSYVTVYFNAFVQ